MTVPQNKETVVKKFKAFIEKKPGLRYEEYQPYMTEYNRDRNAVYNDLVRAKKALRAFETTTLDFDPQLLEKIMRGTRLTFNDSGELEFVPFQSEPMEYRDMAAWVLETYIKELYSR